MGQQTFEFLLLAMSALAVIVFVALYYVRAGYGMFHTPKWGLSVNNKLGWVLMEAPVFLVCFICGGTAACVLMPLLSSFFFFLNYIISSALLSSLS